MHAMKVQRKSTRSSRQAFTFAATFRLPALDLQIVDVMIPHTKATLDVASESSSVHAKSVSVQGILSPIVIEHLLQVNTAMHQENSTEYSQVSRLLYSQSKLERRKGAQALMQENASPNCIKLSPRRPVKTAKKRMLGEEQADYISASASVQAYAAGTSVVAAAHEDQERQQTVDRSVLLMLLCKHLLPWLVRTQLSYEQPADF